MKSDAALRLSVLAGPVVWAITFMAKVFIGGWVCVYPWKAALFASSAIALVITTVAGLLAASHWQRSRSLALAGIGLNAGFALVLLAQLIPELMLKGCE